MAGNALKVSAKADKHGYRIAYEADGPTTPSDIHRAVHVSMQQYGLNRAEYRQLGQRLDCRAGHIALTRLSNTKPDSRVIYLRMG